MSEERLVHILATPSPIHDVKTACGQRLGDLPAEHAITGDRERITCEQCKAMLGEVKAKDWLQGLPEIVKVGTKDGLMEISIAHEMAGVLAGIFSGELKNYPQANNFLAFQFGHGSEDEDEYSTLVTLQRFGKLTPIDAAARAVERMSCALEWLGKALDILEFDSIDGESYAEWIAEARAKSTALKAEVPSVKYFEGDEK